jgi:hypothetical protein
VSTRRGTSPLEEAETLRTPDGLASQPTLSQMQSMLGSALNRRQLADALADRACARNLAVHGFRDEVTFDIDAYAIEAHGSQVGAAYNGHDRTTCFHPLVAYTDTGDMLGVRIRPGNVHTADDVRSFLTPLLPHVRTLGRNVWLRRALGGHRRVATWARRPSHPSLAGIQTEWNARPLSPGRSQPIGGRRATLRTRRRRHP